MQLVNLYLSFVWAFLLKDEDIIVAGLPTTAEILQLSQEGKLYSQEDFEKIQLILEEQGIDPEQLMPQPIKRTPSPPPFQPTDQTGRLKRKLAYLLTLNFKRDFSVPHQKDLVLRLPLPRSRTASKRLRPMSWPAPLRYLW